MDSFDDNLVEAIEEGKIVRVPEFYAKREELPIIRKPQATKLHETHQQLPPSTLIKQRNPLKYPYEHSNWRDRQIISELVDNWQWLIRFERRKKGLTRKQFARLIDETEDNIQAIESGFLPTKDFVLLNKIQKALNINVRKDQKDFTEFKPSISKEMLKRKEELQRLKGDDIEILDEEI